MILLTSVASAFTAMCGLTLRRNAPAWLRVTLYALTLAFAIGIAAHIARATYGAILRPPAYDFMCFWIYGTAARHFHDPYSGAALHAAASLLGIQRSIPPHIAQAFSRGVLDPGMPYPPPSLLLFYPLGFFANIHAAALAWWSLNLAALVALTAVLWRCYFNTSTVFVPFILIAGFLPADWTLMTGQTPILMTLFAVLFLADTNERRSGIWVALAVIAKPIAVLLLLYPIVKRQYLTLISAGVTLAAASVCGLMLTSPHSFWSYVTDNPAARMPGYMFRHPGHQSLFAEVLRWSGDTSAHYRVFDNHLYVALSAAFIVMSAWICAKLEREHRQIAIALLASLALIVYPVTQHFYGTLLLLTLCVAWQQYGAVPGKSPFVTLYWTAEAALMGASIAVSLYILPPAAAQCAFIAFLLSWTTFAAIALRRIRARGMSPAYI